MVFVFLRSFVVAQDRPKSADPSAVAAQEHPTAEHPVTLSTEALTAENFSEALHQYVTTEMEKSGGVFLYKDEETGQDLELVLERVHEDVHATMEGNIYYMCADFRGADGKLYDIDVFMKGETAEALETTDLAVHKEDGVPRYNWAEIDGIWHKVAVKTNEK